MLYRRAGGRYFDSSTEGRAGLQGCKVICGNQDVVAFSPLESGGGKRSNRGTMRRLQPRTPSFFIGRGTRGRLAAAILGGQSAGPQTPALMEQAQLVAFSAAENSSNARRSEYGSECGRKKNTRSMRLN